MSGPRMKLVTKVWDVFYRQWNLEEYMTILAFHEEIGVNFEVKYEIAKLIEDCGYSWKDPLFARWGTDRTVLDFGELQELVVEAIARVLLAQGQENRRTQYKALWGRIKEMLDGGEEVTVLSFNWDTLLETTAAADSDPKYGISTAFVHPGIREEAERTVCLYKPHGSLGFVVCEGKKCSNGKFGLSNWPKIHEHYGTERLVAPECVECGESGQFLIVPPYISKQLPKRFADPQRNQKLRDWYNHTWINTYFRFREADRIISLGYSWPPGDHSVRFQMGQAFALRRRNHEKPPAVDLVLKEPGPEPSTFAAELARRLEDAIGQAGTVKLHLDGVKTFADEA